MHETMSTAELQVQLREERRARHEAEARLAQLARDREHLDRLVQELRGRIDQLGQESAARAAQLRDLEQLLTTTGRTVSGDGASDFIVGMMAKITRRVVLAAADPELARPLMKDRRFIPGLRLMFRIEGIGCRDIPREAWRKSLALVQRGEVPVVIRAEFDWNPAPRKPMLICTVGVSDTQISPCDTEPA